MGKKYIIELENKPFHKGNGDFLYRVKGFNSLVFDMTGVGKLTPYTEPDTDGAYRRGYETAKHECEDCRKIRADAEQELAYKAYQRGLNDAWEAARKIYLPTEYGGIHADVKRQIFNNTSASGIFEKVSASEAIEKIRQYEEKPEKEIKVGDEVTDDKGDTGVCTEISCPANSMCIMYADGTATDISLTGVTQTGRHFPEIAAVLQKMREES